MSESRSRWEKSSLALTEVTRPEVAGSVSISCSSLLEDPLLALIQVKGPFTQSDRLCRTTKKD
jgi:hypothetical protein